MTSIYLTRTTRLSNSLLPRNWYWYLPILPAVPFFINRLFHLKNGIFTLIVLEMIAIGIAVFLSEFSPFREISVNRLLEGFIEDNNFFIQLPGTNKVKHSIMIKWSFNDQFFYFEISHNGVYYPNFERIPHLLSNLFQYSLYEIDELPNGNLFIILYDDSIDEFDSTESWKEYE